MPLRELWTLHLTARTDPVTVWGTRPAVTDVLPVEPRFVPEGAEAVINRALRIRWTPGVSLLSTFEDADGRVWVVSSLAEVGRRRWLDIAISHLGDRSLTSDPSTRAVVPQFHWDVFYRTVSTATGAIIRQRPEPVSRVGLSTNVSTLAFQLRAWFGEDPLQAHTGPLGELGRFADYALGVAPNFDSLAEPALVIVDAAGNAWELATQYTAVTELNVTGMTYRGTDYLTRDLLGGQSWPKSAGLLWRLLKPAVPGATPDFPVSAAGTAPAFFDVPDRATAAALRQG